MKIKLRITIIMAILVCIGAIVGSILYLRYTIEKQSERILKQSIIIKESVPIIEAYNELIVDYNELDFNFQLVASTNPLINLMTPDEIIELLKEIPLGSPFITSFETTAPFGISIGMHGILRDNHKGWDGIPINPEKLENWKLKAFHYGIIDTFGEDRIYGKFITIRLSERVRVFYGHLSKIYYAGTTGREVTPETIIGVMGDSGLSDGAHLHFEIQVWDGLHWVPVNPEKFMINE